MAYLVLSDGTVFEGEPIGAAVPTVGEVVFYTGMTGYQELITDPSGYGQIVCMTYPLIGNYGVNALDTLSDAPAIKGLIVSELCDTPSNWRSEGSLNDYLVTHGVAGLAGVDTRALTRKLRSAGSMTGIITDELPDPKKLKEMSATCVTGPVRATSVKSAREYAGSGVRVAVLDYGSSSAVMKCLIARGCHIMQFPCGSRAEEVLRFDPAGIVLTHGPGDPKDNETERNELKKLIGKKPVLGVGLGHQILALCYGGDTYRLKYGHRGASQPVKEVSSGRVYITAQNNGYAVTAASLKDKGEVTHVNVNDGTVEGVSYGAAQGVQFIPTDGKGPNSTAAIYDDFITAAKCGKYTKAR